MTQQHTIGTTGIDSKAIYEKIKTMNPGDSISYQELSDLTGRDIIRYRHILISARNMALKDSIVFDVIHNYGIKRLSDSEIVKIESARPLGKVRSALKNGTNRLSCAKEISNEELIRKNASLSLFGAIGLFSQPKRIDQVINNQITFTPDSFKEMFGMFANEKLT